MSCCPVADSLALELEYERKIHNTIVRHADEMIAVLRARVLELEAIVREPWRGVAPVDLVLHCPACGRQHLDIGEFRTRVHRKHLCENTREGAGTGCGHLWVPFEYATRGVLDSKKSEEP